MKNFVLEFFLNKRITTFVFAKIGQLVLGWFCCLRFGWGLGWGAKRFRKVGKGQEKLGVLVTIG